MSRVHKVVVIGGGYAGTLAANHLRMRSDMHITLVNARPEFVDRIRLHQYAAGTGEAAIDYGTLLGEGVELVVDSAARIDTAARVVRLESGRALDYDYVIYAVGSVGATPSAVPGAAEFAYDIAEYEPARRLRARLADLALDARVTVVGGGLTGIETAAELAEQGRRVTLVCGRSLAPTFSTGSRRYLAGWLARHGVEVIEGAEVREVRTDAVVLDRDPGAGARHGGADAGAPGGDPGGGVLDGGRPRASALTIWAAGFGVPQLAVASGLRTDGLGRLLTDETLTSIDDERIVAAGDAAAPSGRALRMSCYAAGPLGAQAANTVLSRIEGTEPATLTLGFSGACVSIGRRAGVRQFARKDDTAINVYISGRAGAAIKEATCRLAVARIRREARKPGSVVWVKGDPRPVRPVLNGEVAGSR
ncbi:NAD(P)/FAD-dependent oxidoreductase [Nonomuraea gerenzanensis]|uniref:NADH dehydrogenase n=1 Tax=Nonomuraea gerenzanensis TaxID=93944 RepID=A0A1M4E4S6_9ACTN|nr:FAD-dependent oxidoreductase [Nonomuraea gerenzanensis]UBU16035.1 FAD-dependent oxidoreductase [Nonomuraea gerenzanensis]SBO93837.1 NADH dehydrogenase [Nonomuraea gerenzanensis]